MSKNMHGQSGSVHIKFLNGRSQIREAKFLGIKDVTYTLFLHMAKGLPQISAYTDRKGDIL